MKPGNDIRLKRIQIEPTNRCNFRCGFCRRTHWERPVGDLTYSRFQRIIDQLPAIPHLHLQGQGEPLLNRHLPKMIHCARQRGMTVGTSTNASLLSPVKARALLDAGINRINLSLDTTDPDLFHQSRPGPSIDVVMNNISHLAGIRARDGYDVSLGIAVVAMQTTIGTLPEVVDFAGSVGIEEVYVQNLNNSFLPTEITGAETVPGDHLEPFTLAVGQAKTVAAQNRIKLLVPSLGGPDPTWRCGWPHHGCNITWDGYVSPCCLQPDPEILHFGNIFEKDFASIWTSRLYDQFREDSREGRATICETCPDLNGQMWHPESAPL